MKVKIGPYLNWIGPYQIANLLRYVGVSTKRCRIIGQYLSETWLDDFCQWIHNKKHRTIKIRIDDYDVWSMEHTLSLIILPMLIKLKATKHGAPLVDNEDVPPELRSDVELTWAEDDDRFQSRWDWVLDEMIWAFTQITEDTEPVTAVRHWERVQNGTRLFGKYYQGLWD